MTNEEEGVYGCRRMKTQGEAVVEKEREEEAMYGKAQKAREGWARMAASTRRREWVNWSGRVKSDYFLNVCEYAWVWVDGIGEVLVSDVEWWYMCERVCLQNMLICVMAMVGWSEEWRVKSDDVKKVNKKWIVREIAKRYIKTKQ